MSPHGRNRVRVSAALLSVVVLGACAGRRSSSSPTTSAAQPTQQTSTPNRSAGPNPSGSAEMICGKEARSEIAQSLGVHERRVTTPTWTDDIYSCTYAYPKGSVTLSVKELISAPATTVYFSGLANRLGRAQVVNGLGRAAFIAKNDDVVVRKDDNVLLVDVHAIPAAADAFLPEMKRSDVAENVAAVVMGCWTGG
jgi:hypothetical protein